MACLFIIFPPINLQAVAQNATQAQERHDRDRVLLPHPRPSMQGFRGIVPLDFGGTVEEPLGNMGHTGKLGSPC